MVAWFIVFLVGVLTPHVAARIDSEKLALAQYAHTKAVEYKISPEKFLKLIECESGLEKNAKGDWNGKVHESHGILQFKDKTFAAYAKKYAVAGERNDPYAQIELSARMIADGEAKHWWVCSYKHGFVSEPPVFKK